MANALHCEISRGDINNCSLPHTHALGYSMGFDAHILRRMRNDDKLA